MGEMTKEKLLSRILRGWNTRPSLRLGQMISKSCPNQEGALAYATYHDILDRMEGYYGIPSNDVDLAPLEASAPSLSWHLVSLFGHQGFYARFDPADLKAPGLWVEKIEFGSTTITPQWIGIAAIFTATPCNDPTVMMDGITIQPKLADSLPAPESDEIDYPF